MIENPSFEIEAELAREGEAVERALAEVAELAGRADPRKLWEKREEIYSALAVLYHLAGIGVGSLAVKASFDESFSPEMFENGVLVAIAAARNAYGRIWERDQTPRTVGLP